MNAATLLGIELQSQHELQGCRRIPFACCSRMHCNSIPDKMRLSRQVRRNAAVVPGCTCACRAEPVAAGRHHYVGLGRAGPGSNAAARGGAGAAGEWAGAPAAMDNPHQWLPQRCYTTAILQGSCMC